MYRRKNDKEEGKETLLFFIAMEKRWRGETPAWHKVILTAR